MRIAAFQFSSNEDIASNFTKIERAILQASESKVRLLALQECALCGYPPVESKMSKIDFGLLNDYTVRIQKLAKEHDLYVALGTIRKNEGKRYNTTVLMNPQGEVQGSYDKRALWGWDLDHFTKGKGLGVFDIDGMKIGFRICYEVRFPEYFRELFKENVELCIVSFCDVLEDDSSGKYERIKSHLLTRAVENVMTVVSVNSTSKCQGAPTAVFNVDGIVEKEAPRNQEHLLVFDYKPPELGVAAEGRIKNSRGLLDT